VGCRQSSARRNILFHTTHQQRDTWLGCIGRSHWTSWWPSRQQPGGLSRRCGSSPFDSGLQEASNSLPGDCSIQVLDISGSCKFRLAIPAALKREDARDGDIDLASVTCLRVRVLLTAELVVSAAPCGCPGFWLDNRVRPGSKPTCPSCGRINNFESQTRIGESLVGSA